MCLHCGRGDGSDHSLRSLRMAVSKNGALAMRADVGIGPYENEGGENARFPFSFRKRQKHGGRPMAAPTSVYGRIRGQRTVSPLHWRVWLPLMREPSITHPPRDLESTTLPLRENGSFDSASLRSGWQYQRMGRWR